MTPVLCYKHRTGLIDPSYNGDVIFFIILEIPNTFSFNLIDAIALNKFYKKDKFLNNFINDCKNRPTNVIMQQ